MRNLLKRFVQKYFSASFDLRVRLFNVLAIGGTLVSLLMGILSIINSTDIISMVANFITALLSYALLSYSNSTGRYQRCYIITIIAIFLLLFPALFFFGGGYHGGMPAFFVFAVAFTIFMVEGIKAVVFSLLELLIYVGICFIAYFYPESVQVFSNEAALMMDIIMAFSTVSITLGICLFLHFRLYNEQQKKLDEQNSVLAHASRAKTEFLSNTSHEMRTPLTVISVNVQTVMEILEDMSVSDPDTEELLQNAQSEVMRLARMVGGMLTLASLSESTDKHAVDFSTLLQSSTDMLRLNIQKRGNTLESAIEPGLKVFGSADLLAQVVSNLLQNAGAYTENGNIILSATRTETGITVTVCDNGCGILPEMLPHVFKRGKSTGGTGFGLYLCKTVIESHGGYIHLESKAGNGTAAIFSLPFYEGQFGEDTI